MTPLSTQQTAELLNQLLEAEWQSLLRRVGEASPYVPPDQTRLDELLKRMAEHQRQHFTGLARMIIELEAADPRFPEALTLLPFSILPREQKPVSDAAAPAGAGPFLLERRDPAGLTPPKRPVPRRFR